MGGEAAGGDWRVGGLQLQGPRPYDGGVGGGLAFVEGGGHAAAKGVGWGPLLLSSLLNAQISLSGFQAPSASAMGDSDDEYDRRRRDKFRRERSDYDRSRERDERRRGDDWNDR